MSLRPDNKMLLLPENLLKTLKCTECSMFLSIPPVRIREDGSNICGRCLLLEEEIVEEADYRMTHAKSFETFLQKLLLPCSFSTNGCRRVFKWNTALEHEDKCPFRTYTCPALDVNSTCTTNVTSDNLLTHFEKEHPELVLRSPSFTLNLKHDSQTNRLLSTLDKLYLLQTQISLQDNKLWVCVRFVGPHDEAPNYEYCLEFDNNVLIKGNRTQDDKTTLLQRNVSTSIDLKGLLLLLDNSTTVTCKIKIAQLVSPVVPPNEPSDAMVLCKWLDCLHVEPLYTIHEHETACGLKVERCKWTGCQYQTTRVLLKTHQENCEQRYTNCRWPSCSYEGLHKYIKDHQENCNERYAHCKWKNCSYNGPVKYLDEHQKNCSQREVLCKWPLCSFLSLQKDMQSHEDVCEYRDKNVYKCWFCSWPGSKSSLIQHIRQQHPNRLHEGTGVTVSVGTVLNWYMLTTGEELFRCSCRRGPNCSNTVVFSATYIGDKEGANRYQIIIEIYRPGGDSNLLTLKGRCRHYDGAHKIITVDNEKSLPYVEGNSIKFNFKIKANVWED